MALGKFRRFGFRHFGRQNSRNNSNRQCGTNTGLNPKMMENSDSSITGLRRLTKGGDSMSCGSMLNQIQPGCI
jgi:predicted neuraminidase